MFRTCLHHGIFAVATLLAFGSMTASANEIDCGGKYAIQDGDTLSDIAGRAYGQSNKWTLIYYANQKQFGNEPILVTGNEIHVPCLVAPEPAAVNIEPAGIDSTSGKRKIEVSRIKADINLLTADDYRPFTDRALPEGGMITDIIDNAFKSINEADGGLDYRISWVNDWSAHLNPLLADKVFDMGFPWLQPDCGNYDQLDKPAQFRCDNFFFSKPVFEILVVFFTLKDSQFQFASDQEVIGKRICRPVGYFTFDLDKDGRNWVKEDRITLVGAFVNNITNEIGIRQIDRTDEDENFRRSGAVTFPRQLGLEVRFRFGAYQ